MFIKTFKGYEDRIAELDAEVNQWVQTYGASIEVVDIKVAMAHEPGSSSGMGDLIYCVLYRTPQPVATAPQKQMPAGYES